jgi:hypothetical protein
MSSAEMQEDRIDALERRIGEVEKGMRESARTR